LKVALEQTHAAGIGVFARRDSNGRFEAPLQMEWTLPKRFAQALKRDWLIQMLFNVPADLFCGIKLRIATERSRTATQASAKTGFLRLFRMRIERNILAPWAASRARGAAIHAGSSDGENEFSIVRVIAPGHRFPALVIV
jgi:hypothetical protein